MNPVLNEIRLRIKQIRHEKKMNLTQFSRMLNISRRTYSRIERGLSPLHPHLLISLHKKLKISGDWLLTGEGEKNASKSREITRLKQAFGRDAENVQEMKTFLKTIPGFKVTLKRKMRPFYKRNKTQFEKKTNDFLERFTRQRKNETIEKKKK